MVLVFGSTSGGPARWDWPVRLHEDEFAIDDELARNLVRRDLPRCAAEPLRRLAATGSSNALFRLGDGLLVRLPRQPGGAATIDKEARWLPYIASKLPVSVPEILAVGDPGFGYPERWSVVRWIDGHHPATPEPDADRLAGDLANVVACLRAIDVSTEARDDASLRSYRARPLSTIDAAIRSYMDECRALRDLDLDIDACAELWDRAMTLPDETADEQHWLHGDLLAENLLVREGRLSAVLDFGAMAVGDPTVDLVVTWEVLDGSRRQAFRAALRVDEPAWQRGRAWALAIALMTFPYYWRTMPERCRARLAMARAVLDDEATQRAARARGEA
jgi:aminoglycoside phosphotransferase (APT) family kinase protein